MGYARVEGLGLSARNLDFYLCLGTFAMRACGAVQCKSGLPCASVGSTLGWESPPCDLNTLQIRRYDRRKVRRGFEEGAQGASVHRRHEDKTGHD